MLPHKWKNQILVKVLDSITKILTEIIEFYKRLNMAEGVFCEKGDVTHPKTKAVKWNSPIHHSVIEKIGPKQATKPLEEDKKRKGLLYLSISMYMNMKMCKAVKEQAKSMKITWFYSCEVAETEASRMAKITWYQ